MKLHPKILYRRHLYFATFDAMPKEKSTNTKKSNETKSRTTAGTTTKKSASSASSNKKSPKATTTKKTLTTKKSPTKKTETKAKSTKEHIAKKSEFIKKVAIQAESSKSSLLGKRKISNQIPTRIRIFFWCSLLLFCTAIYKAFLLPKITAPTPEITIQQDEDLNEGIIISDNENDLEVYFPLIVDEIEATEEKISGAQFIYQFYQTFSQKDIPTLISLFDAPLQRNAEIRQFFSAYKINPFIDNIQDNHVRPENIELISTSASGVEEYRFNLNYHLTTNSQDFAETRAIKVRFTDNGPRVASIHCESTRCSFNPFFRPESYGLIQ